MSIAECDERRLWSESLSLLAVTVTEEGSSAIFGDLSNFWGIFAGFSTEMLIAVHVLNP